MEDAPVFTSNGAAERSAGASSADDPSVEASLPTTLDAIRAPVANELDAFRPYFREAMRADHFLLDKITQYVLKQKGKRVRPLLVLLAAKVCGEVTEMSYRAAALVELLHTATLVHDDVVDDADTRRGMFSINALWKNKIAVLMGDFLLSRGLLLSLDHQDYTVLHALSDAVRRMSEGELLQIEKARFLDIDEETYFRIISDKTASLISACTAAGALSATDDDDMVDRMRTYGEKLGLAFQIRDDLFDFGAVDAGKPVGIDMQEKKMTLPLIHALQQASKSDKKRVMKRVRTDEKSAEDVKAITAFAREHGGITYAQERMHVLAEEAYNIAVSFPESPARAALMGLTVYTIQRTR